MSGSYRILAAGLIAGCSLAGPALAQTAGEIQDSQTIHYYINHTSERKAVIRRCDADPDRTRNESDCILAKKADNQAGVNDVKSGFDNAIQSVADFFHKF